MNNLHEFSTAVNENITFLFPKLVIKLFLFSHSLQPVIAEMDLLTRTCAQLAISGTPLIGIVLRLSKVMCGTPDFS